MYMFIKIIYLFIIIIISPINYFINFEDFDCIFLKYLLR